jgi:tRNA (guanine-N7-)-methyltransferase
MPRKSFAIRRLKWSPPDAETAGKYLLEWHSGELYHSPEAYPRIDSAHLFGNEQSLELEIGCGTGEFLCALAARQPGTNFVGVDISLKSLYAAVERARSTGLDNVKFVKAAIQFVYPLLIPGSLHAVYLHFPDPCLRPKYRKRRVFNDTFLDQVQRALAPGGSLSVMTDVPELFTAMLGAIESDPRFEKAHAERYLVGFEHEAKSRYQAVWERYGTSPLRFEVRKV